MRTLVVVLVSILAVLGPSDLASALDDAVQNGSFEFDSDKDGIPDQWSGRNLGPDDRIVPGGVEGAYSFKITGESGVRKFLRQSGRARAPQGLHFILRAYSKTQGGSSQGGLYAYKIDLRYLDGTSESVLLKFRFSPDWELQERDLVLPKTLKRIAFSVVYANQTGTAWFDHVQAKFFLP